MPVTRTAVQKREVSAFIQGLGCGVGHGILETADGVRLRTLLTLNDVELDLVALFQRFVPIQLDR